MRALPVLGLLAAVLAAQANIEVFPPNDAAARGRIDAPLAFVSMMPVVSPAGGDAYTFASLRPADRSNRSNDWLGAWLHAEDANEEALVRGLDVFLSPVLSVPEVSCHLVRHTRAGAAVAGRWDRHVSSRFVMVPGRIATPGGHETPLRGLARAAAVDATPREPGRTPDDVASLPVSGARAPSDLMSRSFLRNSTVVLVMVPAVALLLFVGVLTLRAGKRQAEPS